LKKAGLLSSLFLKSLSCGEGFRVRLKNAEIVNISSFLTSPPAPLRLERGAFFENLTALLEKRRGNYSH
jgi:hypothetical protein